MIPELGKLFLLFHVRYEPEIDLRLGHRRVHGLRAMLDVAAHEATDRARRRIDEAAEHLKVIPAPDELGDAPEFLERIGLERARLQVAQLAGGRTARVLVPPGYLDPALRVSKGHERVDEPPRRIRCDRRLRGVLVHLRRPGGHLDVQDALAPELDLRSSLVEMIAALDRRAVRVQDLLVRTDERAEVGTADLLLALDHELQVDRRPAFDALPRLDREELHDQVALRIRAAAAPELALFDRRVERVALPFVQRVDGLDVIVLVHEQRRFALVDDHLAEDDVRSAIRRILARLETVFGQESPDEGGGLRLGPLVCRDRGEPDVLLEELQGLPRVRFDPRQHIPEAQPAHPPWEGRRALETRHAHRCCPATTGPRLPLESRERNKSANGLRIPVRPWNC